jgi:phospholipid/cholesterol/gamma-HCH transport system substrate-binding protein
MSENATEVLVGGAVLAAAIGFTIYAGQVTGFARDGAGAYELRASFRSAEGVTVGTDVRLAGVKVGTVTTLELNPQTFFADATLAIDPAITLPDDSTVLISQEGLLGGNFVELQPGGSPFDLEPGGEILDTQGAVSLITLLLRAFTGEPGSEAAAPPAEAPLEAPPEGQP